MKRITVIVIRRFFPKADDKTIVFVRGLLFALAGPLWVCGMEIREALTVYSGMPIDWMHILKEAFGPVVAVAGSYWTIAQAADLVPDLFKDDPLVTRIETTVTETKPIQ